MKRTEGRGSVAAIKKISCESNNDAKMGLQEAKTLRRATHEYVLKFVDSFVSDAFSVYLVTEYCEKGSLRDELYRRGPINWSQRMQWFEQLLEGLEHLHSQGIVHRDLKPENVMLTISNKIKIADFGLAKVLERVNFSRYSVQNVGGIVQYMASYCGTKSFMAPEVFNGHYTKMADIFSLGLIFVIIAERKWFWGGNDWFYGIRTSDQRYLGIAMCSESEKNSQAYIDGIRFTTTTYPEIHLIKSMLHPTPAKRLTASDAKTQLLEIKRSGLSYSSTLYWISLGYITNYVRYSRYIGGH